jgi:phage/plasmid-associated DNA primase
MDQFGRFVDERCVTGEVCRARATALYADYKQWAVDGGDRSPLSSTNFGTKLTDRGVAKVHSEHGAVDIGIGLRAKDERQRR